MLGLTFGQELPVRIVSGSFALARGLGAGRGRLCSIQR